jgi:hypothetical protein
MSCDTLRLTLCVRPLTHAFRCACDRTYKGIPYAPIRPPVAPLIDFAGGVLLVLARPRRGRAGSLRAAGQCS